MLAHYQLMPSRREGLMVDKTRQEIALVGLLGNSDMYGLGIRIGVYCQALAGIVASGFYQDSADGIKWANSYFRWALFIALCYITSTSKEF